MKNKMTTENFFAATTYIMIILSIVLRPDMGAPDKLLTVAMIQGVVWLAKLFYRHKNGLSDLNESLGGTVLPTVVKHIGEERDQ